MLNSKAELVFSKLGMSCEVFNDNVYCKCPVHDSSDNPKAFSFSLDKNIWKCWTRDCQQEYGNDIFGLVRGALSKIEGRDVGFNEVVKWSCDLMSIRQSTNLTSKIVDHDESNDFSKLVSILKSENKEKSHSTIKLDDGITYPSKYFLSRGFKEETLKYFEIGDCYNTASKMHDRAVIPIYDDEGKNLISLIGRSIKEYKSPKFLFYPKGFSKSDLFYNYHRAFPYVEKTSSLFLVEGQGDVWRLYEAGIKNVMGLFGKVVSKEQEIKLGKMPLTHIIVLTDNDQAGRESKTQIQRQLNRSYKLSFPKLFTKDIGEMSVEQIKDKILPQIKGSY
jgi:5S rRNA maturation endonuclease (ribonuclease M5)